ncbi:MAG: hypothetical protein A3C02_00820 [Candidatus Andersenbacteria bacterium RIFCSPHIGHO2_02_FULL_45_11]|uniref:Addiction module toxin RelE n=1 Tax=Candidatus Andersenbacteria bacterium RIFCSPHIGHO2_12_FULL_45_11 TaxID=1797281 RepID=A0A1G1X528_9BACT|nr:MAG: hypothetical protein A2805_01605 [Candidatus Andersenbacteria bacterium RIFCSPHIGHO2_01_FULL_46_36]OGY33326.1 MAG: hypothetical protein A3C02_00820 [Candidatus Andersenbacteria bacterium RIFCSPHIGHO2_02_FULL_45_11]OGY34680.1 MAG: hypothetical protein A3D99_05065 [Candidatus Andersenbacteria bacterium RIFCSPHIGHO2_12_FULL_45_11]
MEGNYSVRIEQFAQRHFIKSFEKKYKSHWDVTLLAIIAELERIDRLLLTEKAKTIADLGHVRIVKTEFSIVKSKQSPKGSGNRCIVAWYPDKQYVSILLVYGKTDLGGSNETANWKRMIAENYSELRDTL